MKKKVLGPGQYLNPDIIAYNNYQKVLSGEQDYAF